MPPTVLPPGDPRAGHLARIKVRAKDDFGSQAVYFVSIKVENLGSKRGWETDFAASLKLSVHFPEVLNLFSG